jgi:DnaD/phage-associated family protein
MTEPSSSGDTVGVASEVFEATMPRIRDLAELKAVLMVSYLATRRHAAGVAFADMVVPSVARVILGTGSPEPAELRLRAVLDRAVANGSLLRLRVEQGDRSDDYVFPATAVNRRRIERLRNDDVEAARSLGVPPDADAVIHRVNAFSLYEQYIGPLTPLITEHLRDAEKSFPRDWLEEAVLTAARHNKRTWRYIEAILSRWQETGGPDGGTGSDG